MLGRPGSFATSSQICRPLVRLLLQPSLSTPRPTSFLIGVNLIAIPRQGGSEPSMSSGKEVVNDQSAKVRSSCLCVTIASHFRFREHNIFDNLLMTGHKIDRTIASRRLVHQLL